MPVTSCHVRTTQQDFIVRYNHSGVDLALYLPSAITGEFIIMPWISSLISGYAVVATTSPQFKFLSSRIDFYLRRGLLDIYINQTPVLPLSSYDDVVQSSLLPRGHVTF